MRTWRHRGTFIGIAMFGALLVLSAGRSAQAEELLTEIRREARTDTIEEKLQLIEAAYRKGRFDLALSLSESLKETLQFEEQLREDPGTPLLAAAKSSKVADLPAEWAEWARGWSSYRALTLKETAGIARAAEPVDLIVAFPVAETTDLQRETRVARVNGEDGTLREVASQIYGEVRRGDSRICRLVFFADAPASGEAAYLILHGNPLAELPCYATDLTVTGEGCGVEVTNNHFVADLSDQTGQLERVRYRREHGLELYAGGKGHGEPPTIDWSNDYVDQDHYQKLRIRNWASPPNYEVIRGPLCVRVRHWGFPHSPIHPVFTPSRMHIDQTYVFYAGKDYFLKEGKMEAAKDFDFTTMRDDEWVLSGYSFTEKVWIDGAGKLREGEVPAEEGEHLWGVGFHHPESRDAFIGLWLDHVLSPAGPLTRNAPPILHYHQHGQLWSRSPIGGGDLHWYAGTVLSERNAYLVAPFPQGDAAPVIEGIRKRFLAPLVASPGEPPDLKKHVQVGSLARYGETEETGALKHALWEAIRDVTDEQLYRIDGNVVDLGYVYDLKVRNGVAEVLMTMPHRGRPVYDYLVFRGGGRNTEGIRERLLRVPGVSQVVVRFTWEPAWSAARLTDAGKRSLGLEE
ncbi:MAG: hypothetical protein GHCLOJNM_00362 [bacterium]|nr:hypothetical protein [bacterium]